MQKPAPTPTPTPAPTPFDPEAFIAKHETAKLSENLVLVRVEYPGAGEIAPRTGIYSTFTVGPGDAPLAQWSDGSVA